MLFRSNAGIEVGRGSSANTLLMWNESTDRWTFTNDGTNYNNIITQTELDAKVASVTGTAGRISSSGGVNPVIDLVTAGAGAASPTGGISAITVDAYGRVTAVTGGANYITASASITGSAAYLTTARTLTIGSTGKTFNGSADVSWTLSDIGAPANNATHYIGTTAITLNRASAAQIGRAHV